MSDVTTDRAGFGVEWWPLERPIPYARNARVCPEPAIAKVAVSIHEFGFRNPILVDAGGVIIAGNTRLLSAQRRDPASGRYVGSVAHLLPEPQAEAVVHSAQMPLFGSDTSL